ncbi:hypothetical protein HDA32_003398 [Spinactinospora alkalitolerans]|uniref:Uncharacterized protein n=1 Tax=Spinactinospora alkalitolerans TaxID=687207 RepID=A0A852TWG9_9ACTN|nr:hypothetical protein [Spinactinospora alkalitolerans]NYE48278.1 hypothetical protein [Spinactinospora alkalitolerans]
MAEERERDEKRNGEKEPGGRRRGLRNAWPSRLLPGIVLLAVRILWDVFQP